MQKAIDAIFENGVFKPKKKVAIPERTKLKLIVLKEDNNESVLLARKQSNSLLSVAGIGASGLKDVSENPDKTSKVFTFDIHFIQFGKFLIVP